MGFRVLGCLGVRPDGGTALRWGKPKRRVLPVQWTGGETMTEGRVPTGRRRGSVGAELLPG